MKSDKGLFYSALAGVCFIPVMTLFFILDPDRLVNGQYTFMPPCLTVQFFGVECPGCGMGRAFCLIAHGRFSEALSFNKASCVIFMLISLVILSAMVYFGQKLMRIYMNRLKT